MKPLVQVDNLGKQFTSKRQDATLGRALSHLSFRKPTFRKPTLKPNTQAEWALKEVSFEVHRGQIVGLIGNNGSGKSTLLKIISGILKPSEGQVQIHGKLLSLLSVHMHFFSELTGRESLKLLATSLGSSFEEIECLMPKITEFMQIDFALDREIHSYSAGMYARLAVATLLHLPFDVLILDESLGNFDYSFMERCIARISELRTFGKSFLVVNHNLYYHGLYTHSLELQQGRLISASPSALPRHPSPSFPLAYGRP